MLHGSRPYTSGTYALIADAARGQRHSSDCASAGPAIARPGCRRRAHAVDGTITDERVFANLTCGGLMPDLSHT